MEVIVTRDAGWFAERAQPFLQARIERNILVTVLADALGGHYGDRGQLFAFAVDEKGEVLGAALRTPPRLMLAGDFPARATASLVDAWLEQDPELPGVAGVPETTRAIARAWGRKTGGRSNTSLEMALHDLPEVRDPARPAPGALREPGARERSLIVDWFAAFHHEVGLSPSARPIESIVDARLADGLLLLWDHGGPVSLVGLNHPAAGVVRIGPVYTPPELRRRGYAGTAVAAASRRALAGGARSCILYTDLLNPTSNKIYAEVGYRRVAQWEELEFERFGPSVRGNSETDDS